MGLGPRESASAYQVHRVAPRILGFACRLPSVAIGVSPQRGPDGERRRTAPPEPGLTEHSASPPPPLPDSEGAGGGLSPLEGATVGVLLRRAQRKRSSSVFGGYHERRRSLASWTGSTEHPCCVLWMQPMPMHGAGQINSAWRAVAQETTDGMLSLVSVSTKKRPSRFR